MSLIRAHESLWASDRRAYEGGGQAFPRVVESLCPTERLSRPDQRRAYGIFHDNVSCTISIDVERSSRFSPLHCLYLSAAYNEKHSSKTGPASRTVPAALSFRTVWLWISAKV